jgi:uncharacterized membrane protein
MINFLFTKTPLFFFTQSLWRDEAFSYFLAKQSFLNILYLSSKDFTPPLYEFLLKTWIYFFGSSEIALRSLSLIAYLILAYFFYLFLNNIFKIKTFWIYIYLLLFFCNPMLHYYAFEARTYSFLALFSFMSFYFFIKKGWRGYFISTLLGLYSHYFMILILLVQGVLILFIKVNKRKYFYELCKPVFFFIPWIIYVLLNKNPFIEPFWLKEIPKNYKAYLPITLYSGYDQSFLFVKDIASRLNSILIMFLLSGIFIRNKFSENFFNIILSWALIPSFVILIISIYKPLFFPRYLILSTPAVILLIVLILEKSNLAIKCISAVLIFFLTMNYASLQIKYNRKASYNKVINEIKSIANKKDLIYVDSELNYHIAKYYFYENRVYIFNKNYNEIPNFTGKVLIPKNSIATSLPKYPNKAFVLHNNLSYNIQSLR